MTSHHISRKHTSGRRHWRHQRATAIALIPLVLWFVSAVLTLTSFDLATVQAWFAKPFVVVGFAAMLVIMIYHAYLGLEVVIDDYIHTPCTHVWALRTLHAISALLVLTTCAAAIVYLT